MWICYLISIYCMFYLYFTNLQGSILFCKSKKKSHNHFLPNFSEYVSIDLIPKGARQIRVVEAAPSGNFLALRNPTNGSEFYLNGNFMIQVNISCKLLLHYNQWCKVTKYFYSSRFVW